MLRTIMRHGIVILSLFLVACSPLAVAASDPSPLPSPAGNNWSITLTQSGGFVGMSLVVTVSSDGQLQAQNIRTQKSATQTVPTATLASIELLISQLSILTPTPLSYTCADCFYYDLQGQVGGMPIQIHADDTTLPGSSAEALVRLLQQLRDDALRSAP